MKGKTAGKTKKGKSGRIKNRCVVDDGVMFGDFELSREKPLSYEDADKVENVKGVDRVNSMGKYTIIVWVASVYNKNDVIKRVKKVLGCE